MTTTLLPKTKQKKSKYSFFQGFLETEIFFYSKFVPELSRLGAPLPLLYPLVHSDYAALNREVLLLDDLQSKGFYAVQRDSVCAEGTCRNG